MNRRGNVLRDLPDARAGEFSEILVAAPGVRIERIVSHGQASPPGFWYDQPETEWVLLLEGAARLRFADEAEDWVLGLGDHVEIAAHRRHRVEWTAPDRPTIWLAVFYDLPADGSLPAGGDERVAQHQRDVAGDIERQKIGVAPAGDP